MPGTTISISGDSNESKVLLSSENITIIETDASLSNLETYMNLVETNVATLETSLNAKIDDLSLNLYGDLDTLDTSLNVKIDDLSLNLYSELDIVDTSLNERIDDLSLNLYSELDIVDTSLNERIDDLSLNLYRDLDTLDNSLNERIDDLSLNLSLEINTDSLNVVNDAHIKGDLYLGIEPKGGVIYTSKSNNIIIDPHPANNDTGGNVYIKGNLFVDGSNTIVNTETLSIKDNIIQLNGSGKLELTSGIEVNRGDDISSSRFLWDETNKYWTTENKPLVVENINIVQSIQTVSGDLDESVSNLKSSIHDNIGLIQTVSGDLANSVNALESSIQDNTTLIKIVSGDLAAMDISFTTQDGFITNLECDTINVSDIDIKGMNFNIYSYEVAFPNGYKFDADSVFFHNKTVQDNSSTLGYGGHTAFGKYSLINLDSNQIIGNTAFGESSLKNTTVGSENTSIGYASLLSNTTGSYNVGLGFAALNQNTIGNYNVAIGYQSAHSNIEQGENVSIGYQSLYSNISGGKMVAIGHEALTNNTSGTENTVLGYHAGINIETGSNNTLLGNESGNNIVSSSKNVFIGNETNSRTNDPENQIVIGSNALGHGDNIAVIGNETCSAWHPGETGICDLGSTEYEFKDLYLDGTANLTNINSISNAETKFTTIDPSSNLRIIMSGLPTTDPNNPGQLWNHGGKLSISI